MARKKDNFDPLGGFVGGPAKPNKKSKRVNDLLGSGKDTGSGSIYDEGDYTPTHSGRTDALTATGEAVPEKKKKKGFFFGRKEKPAYAAEQPKDSGFDSSEYKLDIKSGVMDTGIAERYAEDEYTQVSDNYYERREENTFEEELPSEPEEEEEDDFFEPEHKSPEPIQHHISNIPKSVRHEIKVKEEDIQNPLVNKSEPIQTHPYICYLCGEVSTDALPQFGFGDGSNPDDFVPLCKTCLHAVTTLMKFREPSDESEIKAEWRSICPGLDDSRAGKIITEGRKHH
ncbi:MAG: hypothetical protein Q4Q53_03895 [Methanocorpusculum sp.]|nr:hypothetical protein [Methanocorpusculum sp.]